jgi:flagellar hook-associated protein 1 FlgK
MSSTFMGLETAKRGIFAQQGALYTTGNNIANANTPGYSRQRVNFVQSTAIPAPGINRAQTPGQMGTGVEMGSIQRVRESFIDIQYRGENNKLGYWDSKANALSKMEDIVNEPSTNGLAATMSQFWQSLQDLSVNPENEGARAVVLQRGLAVTETFHYMHDSIQAIKDDLGNEINVSLVDMNSILKQINEVNKQISEIEPHGYLPNDLYDQRDQLVDQLSNYVNISVDRISSGGQSLAQAEGIYKITLMDANGNKMENADGTDLLVVDKDSYTAFGVVDGTDNNNDNIPDQPSGDGVGDLSLYKIDSRTAEIDPSFTTLPVYDQDTNTTIFSQGKMRGLIENFGYNIDAGTPPTVNGTYPYMLDNLDKMAFTFGTIFNEIHSQGIDLNNNPGSSEFFKNLSETDYKGASKDIQMNTDLQTREIAASVSGDAGDGSNAINLGNIQKFQLTPETLLLIGGGSLDITALNLPIQSGTISSFYEGVIGRLGVDSKQAIRLNDNSALLLQSVNENRQSVSSVSLDEEMTNMIKFQQAYNSSARMITVVDEMLDKIINGMGRVGL